MWEDPALSRFLERLATMGRVICFDKRGTGISDPVPLGAIPTIERWMDDITTVIDEVGCKRIVVFGHGDGGPIAMLFAATYPERTEALVLGDTFARMRHAADYPEGLSEVDADRKGTQLYESWGREDRRPRPTDSARRDVFYDPSSSAWRTRFERLSLSPGALRTMYPVCDLDVDVRSVLGSIRVPTLVFHRRDNFWIPVAFGRYLAQHIADARFVEIEGIDHRYYQGNADGMLSAVQEFVTGEHEAPEDDRVLATVLFTDIVGSTEKATSLGDQAWGDLLVRHHALVRREIAHFSWARDRDRWGTGSWRCSTARRAGCDAGSPFVMPCVRSASRCARGYTRASACAWEKTWAGSPSISRRAFPRKREPARC
jgi:pimeloyl-ACP methyl ester carboxylesterase